VFICLGNDTSSVAQPQAVTHCSGVGTVEEAKLSTPMATVP